MRWGGWTEGPEDYLVPLDLAEKKNPGPVDPVDEDGSIIMRFYESGQTIAPADFRDAVSAVLAEMGNAR